MPAEILERYQDHPRSEQNMSQSSAHSPVGSTISPTSSGGGSSGGFPSPSISDHIIGWSGGVSTNHQLDDNGFVDAVPFPFPPRRNVFIEPGSGMRDVPMWLKNLRLHKYTSLFQQLNYDDMMHLTETQLERQGVTKGARHKIVVCVMKLKERVELLKQLEKDLVEPGGVRTTLAELRQMITTPIRPYPPPGRPEPDQAKIDGVDLMAEDLDEENLPAHFTRVLGKLCMQMFAVANSETEDDCFSTLLHILDRCINHEAFTQAQKRRVISWKHVVKRVWNPAKVNRGSFGPTPSGSPPQRSGSWNKDRRGNGGNKWGHMGSPPRTPRKLNRSYSDTAANGPLMTNFSCPAGLLQNMNVQYAMAYVLAQAQQMAASQGQGGHSFPFTTTAPSGNPSYNEIPSVQRTTSLPPMHNVQQMAAMLALATGQHPPQSGGGQGGAGGGLLAPQHHYHHSASSSSGNRLQPPTGSPTHGLPGSLPQNHQGLSSLTAPGATPQRRTPTPPTGPACGQAGNHWSPVDLRKAHSLPQPVRQEKCPSSGILGHHTAAGTNNTQSPLEVMLNTGTSAATPAHSHMMAPTQRQTSSVFGDQQTHQPGSPFQWFTSGHCRLEDSRATGYGNAGSGPFGPTSPWAPLTKQQSAPAGTGAAGPRTVVLPERQGILEESPTSPPNLMAFNFEHSSMVDINSRLEKLCRSVAEVAIGGLETPDPSVANGKLF